LRQRGETLGLFHGLQWAADMGFDNVDFILDSKTIIDAFNGGSNNIIEFGSTIQMCRQLYHTFSKFYS